MLHLCTYRITSKIRWRGYRFLSKRKEKLTTWRTLPTHGNHDISDLQKRLPTHYWREPNIDIRQRPYPPDIPLNTRSPAVCLSRGSQNRGGCSRLRLECVLISVLCCIRRHLAYNVATTYTSDFKLISTSRSTTYIYYSRSDFLS